VLALVARRPRYVYVIANSIHFRSPVRGGHVVRLVARMLLNACAVISNRVFVHGIGLAQELWEPVRRKTTEVIISTISEEDFMPAERDEERRLEVLCVSRLVPSKRVDVAVEMTRILLDRGVDARLTVVGRGPLRDDLADRARSLSLGDRVVFTGFVDDRQQLRDLYRRSHVFVLPTEMEGISLAIQEAMAAGLPVVSTHAGALARFLQHGIDSIVVEGPYPAAFADAVGQLAASRDLRLLIGRAGQQKVARLGNAAWVAAVADLVEADLRG
jgi:glycosyltransferase involved in cell wall biosynthesis